MRISGRKGGCSHARRQQARRAKAATATKVIGADGNASPMRSERRDLWGYRQNSGDILHAREDFFFRACIALNSAKPTLVFPA